MTDTGGEGDIAYVYVAGFAPLDRRNEVFEQVLAANPGLKNVATFGTVSDSTAAEVQTQAAAVLTANPGIKAIFAPYDEFAKGAVLAVEAAGLQDKVKVYGADISTADIAVLTAENSPWVATAGTDPANVGRVAVRAAALLAAGETVDPQIVVNPALITQQFLRDNSITTIEQLGKQAARARHAGARDGALVRVARPVTSGHPDAADHPAASGAVVTLHGLRKHYAATQALAGVDLELRAGEVYGLVGANGAGKSTLIRILAGAVVPDAGEVRVAGEPLRLGSPLVALRAGIATVHQQIDAGILPGHRSPRTSPSTCSAAADRPAVPRARGDRARRGRSRTAPASTCRSTRPSTGSARAIASRSSSREPSRASRGSSSSTSRPPRCPSARPSGCSRRSGA